MKLLNGQRPVRLAYFVSHPIQYQAPLLRRLAQEPDIDLKVFFSSDHSTRAFVDEGFKVRVEWDVPLLDGYAYEFLPRLGKGRESGAASTFSYGIFDRLWCGGFDAVWVHGYHTADALQAIFFASVLNLPVLLRAESTLHGRERSAGKMLVKAVFFRLLRKHVSGVLPIGKANAAYWRYSLGEDFPLYPMPYAVDNAFFRHRATQAASGTEALRSQLGFAPGRPVILFASKLQPRKRCGDLLAAFLQIKARGSNAYLLLIGDGEERGELAARARTSAAGQDICFLGFKNQTELPPYFVLCDVFVLPSMHEPWGLVLNEVMNAARAVIVSDDVGCQPDLVEDGVNGRVYPVGNVQALAAAIEDVLCTPDRARAMGDAGLRRIEQYSFAEDVAGLRQALADQVPGFPAILPKPSPTGDAQAHLQAER